MSHAISKQFEIVNKKLDRNLDEIKNLFKKLETLIKTKDRKYPSSFVVLTKSRAKDNVAATTKEMYKNLFTDYISLSSFLQNKICDLYLICECCSQIQGSNILLW